MAKIVDLQSYRSRQLAERVFGPWEKRFGESYNDATVLRDLSNDALFRLAQPGDESTAAFYELVMGALDLGPADRFHYLDKAEQLRVVDLHLFLADHVRYELMRRLGWVVRYTGQRLSLMELIEELEEIEELLSGFVIIEVRGRGIGIIIDRVSRVVTIDVDSIQPPPQMLSGIGAEYIQGVTSGESGEFLIILDVSRLFNPRELSELDSLR